MNQITSGRVGAWAVGLVLAIVPGSGRLAAEPGGTITGRIVYEGAAPEPKPIQFGAEKQCSLLHQIAPNYEDIVVNSDGTLKWVLVYVKEGAPEDPAAPSEPIVFDQQGCVFAPHVAVARVGQPVEFRNNDAILHNVRGTSKQAQAFNVAQPIQGMKSQKVFKKPEIGMPLKCDVHFWMTAYLHILPHPFYAVTGDDGSFTIAGLPPGTYTIEAWHEKLGVKTETVSVADGQSASLAFTYTAQ